MAFSALGTVSCRNAAWPSHDCYEQSNLIATGGLPSVFSCQSRTTRGREDRFNARRLNRISWAQSQVDSQTRAALDPPTRIHPAAEPAATAAAATSASRCQQAKSSYSTNKTTKFIVGCATRRTVMDAVWASVHVASRLNCQLPEHSFSSNNINVNSSWYFGEFDWVRF